MERNELCPCGSGKKSKKCCGFKAQADKQKTSGLLRGAYIPSVNASTNLSKRVFSVVNNQKQEKVAPEHHHECSCCDHEEKS